METSSGVDVMVEALPWELLTDGILLVIMSFLDAKSLMSAAKTCKHWYRVAHDNSLWKDLVINKVSSKDWQKRVLAKVEEEYRQGERRPHGTWKVEYVRMEDEAPLVLSETLEGHTDEIYHINFSASGNLFSTTGRDASVRVWKFGYPCTLYAENTDLDSILVYTRFSDFNQSETLLLVAGIASYIMGADSCTLILSVKGLEILYAVSGSNANFRGCWLDDTAFLNGTYIFTPSGNRRFLIKKHKVTERRKSDQKIQTLISKMDAKGQQLMILHPYCRNNDFARIAYLPTRCLQQPMTPSSDAVLPLSEQFEYIDSEQQDEQSEATTKSEVRPGSSQDFDSVASCSASEDVSPVLILANSTVEYPSTGFLSFYRVPETTEETFEACKKFGSADAGCPGGLVGMRLSSDNRFIAFNYRSCTLEDGEYENGCYVKSIDLKVFDLYNMCFTDIAYKGHSATSEDHLSYIFPAVSEHYIASGSEVEKGYLWDRHFGNILGELEHAAQPGNGGVNASVFHPNSEEVLITLGDDRKIKVWRSKRLLRELGHSDTPISVFNQNSHKNTEQYRAHDKSTSKGGSSRFDNGVDQPDGFIDDEVVTCCIMKKKSRKTKMSF
ncbi:F-box/WD repeat-containing protein 5-like [Mizuhopecten yessoensis]|uniref:F-box/WD repeat-containing protein 5 n=1 Tax=Mizuhopecten yessoensis TaxID=6573 RepID=A0A210QZP8_MIZYE|nr:F-box/WD repeat-containing protein 5-like [Mizuhopecten yessoensis]XP_021346130.1 F-box/WD repeat-containing protein 5-like [Mizuhopecten yessoensis]XP_021346131.1 F-box/WD repeat-containing protein 5-like [Mizuhopecten yessoensis]OWF54111.1 F-box/WD repeat-containing protein 5 [Mizuhopecten yessoensis]